MRASNGIDCVRPPRGRPAYGPSRADRAGLLFQFLSWSASGLLVVAGLLPWLPLPVPLGLIDDRVFLVAGVFLAACALFASWLTFRWRLAIGVLIASSALGLGLLVSLPAEYGFVALSRQQPYQLTMPYPNSRAYHRHRPDFSVWYRFDHEGWRSPPAPAQPRGWVLFLGCSFTFGHGVSDDETYVACLARDAWPDYQLRSKAYGGSGTVLAHRILVDELARADRPAAVVYGWIEDHRRRNFRQRPEGDWLGRLAPRLEHSPEAEELRALKDQWLAQGPQSEVEIDDPLSGAISQALIGDMARRCREAGVTFYWVALPKGPFAPAANELPDLAPPRGVELIDVRGVSQSYFRHDPHPTPAWHAAVARAIADDPRTNWLRKAPRAARVAAALRP